VPLIYFAHDIHERRMAKTGILAAGDGEDDGSLTPGISSGLNAQRARAMRLVEDFCFTHADLTLLPTKEEVREVKTRHPSANVERLTWFAIETVPHAALADTVRRAVFIGGERHEPNRDGVTWLLADIWPHVCHLYDELVIIGDWSEATIAAVKPQPAPGTLAPSNVRFAGRLSASEVDDLMSTSLVGLSPLRFGAGQKRKTLDYLAHGLPAVSTSFGVQGHTQVDGDYPGVVLGDTADDWVAALIRLAGDDSRDDWQRLSREGAAYVASDYIPATHRLAVQAIFSRWDGRE
jgi:hypothetical protein